MGDMAVPGTLVSIVDDETAVRKALRRLCVASDLRAETFASGEKFIDSLASTCPDCVVLDLHMPGLSGLDVLHKLAVSSKRIPTIVITAHDEPGTHAQCLAAGAAEYLRKPVDGQIRLAAITRALERGPDACGRNRSLPGNDPTDTN
jgi:FixJ family two-component response regulator